MCIAKMVSISLCSHPDLRQNSLPSLGVAETGGMDTYAKRVCRRRRDRGGNAPQSATFPDVHNLFTNKSAKSIVILHKIWYNTDASMINALHAI